MIDLRGFIAVKGVKAIGNKLSALPVTEVSLEAPVEELEMALEKELQAAREADLIREGAQVEKIEEASDEPETEQAEESATSAEGQGSLF